MVGATGARAHWRPNRETASIVQDHPSIIRQPGELADPAALRPGINVEVRRPQTADGAQSHHSSDRGRIQYFTIVADLGASWVIVPGPNRVRAPIPLRGAVTHVVDLSDR